jgi:hypothetical protein
MFDLIDSVHHFSFGIPDANLVIEPFFDDYKDVPINGVAEDPATLFQKNSRKSVPPRKKTVS